MECRKGFPPGLCCGITTTGVTYVQKVLACQRDVLSKRVNIRKGGGQTDMATRKPINVRKGAWDLAHQKTATYLPGAPGGDGGAGDRQGLRDVPAPVRTCTEARSGAQYIVVFAIKNTVLHTSHRSSTFIFPAPAVMRPPGAIRSLLQ
jgi:hypothetical protein